MGEALSLDRLLLVLMTTTSWNTALFRSSMFSPSLAAALMLCAYTYLRVTKKRLRVPLPPGPPKTVPFLGSLVHLPRHNAWEVYKRWGKEYNSDILHIGGTGMNIIVLNSTKVAVDLFDKRSWMYSSRPRLPISDIMNWSFLFAGMVYGDAWRARRKLFQKHFHPSNPEVHQPLALRSTRERLLPLLLKSSDSWEEICRHTIGAYILTIAYGIKTKPLNDPFVTLSGEATRLINEVFLSPISFLLFLVPMLQSVPEWCLGPSFKRRAKKARGLAREFRNAPFDEVERMISQGTAETSFTSMCLEELLESAPGPDLEREREEIKDTASIFFAGGVDTTLAGISTFIFAMVLHPDKQAKAQEELDRVIGNNVRLPDYEDEENLPYLSALLKETIRWRPWIPQGIPHLNEREDVYNGYYIPKDSIIIPNVWGMLHDEREYPDPESFKPERFLNSHGKLDMEIRDPASLLFGFGRRACPGAHIAQTTLFILAAHILSVFTIKPAVDENGVIKEPSLDWPDQTICPPFPFECQFIPRSEDASRLIRAHSLQD